MTKIYFTWKDVDRATDYIASKIKENGTKITSVCGIPRGGLILAVILSHKLDVPYKSIDYSSTEVLVVDDISDTGRTLSRIKEMLYNKKSVTIATIHYNQKSEIKPDIYYQLTNDWIVYPWETENTSKVDYAIAKT